MIAAIAKELDDALRAKGVPLRVSMGPERTDTATPARERIVVEYDDSAGDSLSTAPQHRNTAIKFVRLVGAKLTIYAQDSNAGAMDYEHRRRAEHALDLVLVALDGVVRGRRNTLAIRGSRFIRPDDLAQGKHFGGAAYELTFTVDRAVADTTWKNETTPTVTMAEGGLRMRNTTRVSLANGPGADDDGDGVPDDAETSCGGA